MFQKKQKKKKKQRDDHILMIPNYSRPWWKNLQQPELQQYPELPSTFFTCAVYVLQFEYLHIEYILYGT